MTNHKIFFQNSNRMADVPDASAHLVVTSPPYPMISMWDELFTEQDPEAGKALARGDGAAAFELMHMLLDEVWAEVFRVLCGGGIACINIGDAVRTLDNSFQLYSSHTRIMSKCLKLGFNALPAIIWRKQTNAPNKFMGSGMLPPGAYVTLEHEFILILRKGNKRTFTGGEKDIRAESAYFWEERNNWFSDVWFDLKGKRQKISEDDARARSAAFPFELPYRLINMFSIKGDTVLDPFLGSGTTSLAAAAAERNSVGYESDAGFAQVIEQEMIGLPLSANKRIAERLAAHEEFVAARRAAGKETSKKNIPHGLPCISAQEERLHIRNVDSVRKTGPGEFEVDYFTQPAARK